MDIFLKSLILCVILIEYCYFFIVYIFLWKIGSNLFICYIYVKELRYKLLNFKNGSKILYLLYCLEIGCDIVKWVDSFVLFCIFWLMCFFIIDIVYDFYDWVNVVFVYEMSYK